MIKIGNIMLRKPNQDSSLESRNQKSYFNEFNDRKFKNSDLAHMSLDHAKRTRKERSLTHNSIDFRSRQRGNFKDVSNTKLITESSDI